MATAPQLTRMAQLASEEGIRNRKRILYAVTSSGTDGISTIELRRSLDLGESTVGGHLRALLAEGMVEKSPPDGVRVRWFAAGNAPVVKKRSRVDQRRLQREQEAAEWIESSPVRRVVAAGSQKPPKTRGVRSVWELA